MHIPIEDMFSRVDIVVGPVPESSVTSGIPAGESSGVVISYSGVFGCETMGDDACSLVMR